MNTRTMSSTMWPVVGTVLILGLLTSCFFGGGKMERRSFGDGSLPLAERESVEQFEARFYPAYRALMADLQSEFQTKGYLRESSAISGSGGGANLFFPLIVFPVSVPCEDLTRLANEHFAPLGLVEVRRSDNEFSCDLTWGDKENGGLISFGAEEYTVLSGWSGTRPIEDPSRKGYGYVTPLWEDALPKIEDWIQSDSAQSE